MTTKVLNLQFLSLLLGFMSCNLNGNNASKNINNTSTSASINLPCTTWVKGGAFTGLCGNKYSLVIIAEARFVSYRHKMTKAVVLDILLQEKLNSDTINLDDRIELKCIYKSHIRPGEKFILFAYAYEGDHTISGIESISKISNLKDPAVNSIKSYIAHQQNPLVIKNDLELWDSLGYGNQLSQIISCHENEVN